MLKINEKFSVYIEKDHFVCEYTNGEDRHVYRMTPMDTVELLYVLRGMSEHEFNDIYSICHVIDPRPGYWIGFRNNRKVFLPMKQAFILMIAMEKALGKFV